MDKIHLTNFYDNFCDLTLHNCNNITIDVLHSINKVWENKTFLFGSKSDAIDLVKQ